MEAATARFIGTGAIIDNPAEASRVHNKGGFGVPQSGGGLELDLLEATYLADTGRIDLRDDSGGPLALSGLLAAALERTPSFGTMYAVYRDFRERGFILRHEDARNRPAPLELEEGTVRFSVYARGERPGRTAPAIRVLGTSERTPFLLERLLTECETLRKSGVEGVLSVVDEEGDTTHYRFRTMDPAGPFPGPTPGPPATGALLDDRVLVDDPPAAAELLAEGSYGRQLGSRLQLSLLEAIFLQGKGRLVVKEKAGRSVVSPTTLQQRAKGVDPHYALRSQVYEDLRKRGFLVKTGFKFGTHFRAYDTPPATSHARYLVHAVGENHTGHWADISRAVRLAHGVRKELLFARVAGTTVRYLSLTRFRP